MICQAVIMAGGKGTRLRSVTNNEIPKPMVLIAGRPLLEWQIETLRQQGVTDIVLIIGHLGHVIREHFGSGDKFGVSIRYIEETTPLGTAGALSMVLPLLKEAEFFLVFGDVLFDIDLARMERFHRKKESAATLFVHPNSHPYDSDLVVLGTDDQVLYFHSKHEVRKSWYSNCVNAGFYILHTDLCKLIPKNTKLDLEKEFLSDLIRNKTTVYGYRSPEYIKDAGTVERLAEVERELESGFVANRNLKKRQQAIFLDRDGTINKKNGLVFRQEQFELEANAAQAVRLINSSGYLAIVVTNQPVVARGLCSVDDVNEIHRKMETLLGEEKSYLDDIRFCPHHPDKGYSEENPAYKISCHCRKPDTGMLEECAERYNIDLNASWMVGDTTIDVQTGKNAGCRTALVLTGDAGTDGKYNVKPDITCKDLLDAVQKITMEC